VTVQQASLLLTCRRPAWLPRDAGRSDTNVNATACRCPINDLLHLKARGAVFLAGFCSLVSPNRFSNHTAAVTSPAEEHAGRGWKQPTGPPRLTRWQSGAASPAAVSESRGLLCARRCQPVITTRLVQGNIGLLEQMFALTESVLLNYTHTDKWMFPLPSNFSFSKNAIQKQEGVAFLGTFFKYICFMMSCWVITYIYSFLYLFIYTFILVFIYLFIHLFKHLFIYSCIYLFIYTFI